MRMKLQYFSSISNCKKTKLFRKHFELFYSVFLMVKLLIRFSILNEQKLADRMIISPFLGMWAINIFFLVIGIILTLHVSTSIRITNLFRNDE